jgi:dTDP-4-dehydrorhamnose 3,5-epimerase-like enzyme
MTYTSLSDCRMLDLPRIERPEGNLTPVEGQREVPFALSRVYYFYDIPGGAARGGHAHRQLEQVIVAVMGAFDVVLDDGSRREVFRLSRAYRGLYVPRMIWRELENFSSGGIGVVLASQPYAEEDYVRDYDRFRDQKQEAIR